MTPSAKRAGYSVSADFNASAAADSDSFSDSALLFTDFTVTREDFGSVRWLEPVSLRHLKTAGSSGTIEPGRATEDTDKYVDISRVVRIERGAVYVYDEDCGVPAPSPGEGLKRRAEVTLFKCLPKKNPDCLAVRAKYEERVIRQTRRMGADLLQYNAITGTWRFAIEL